MKLWIAMVSLMLAGCASLSNSGGEQSVVVLDAKTKLIGVTCSGLVDGWPDCWARAKKACSNGYTQESRVENGVHRELTFRCK